MLKRVSLGEVQPAGGAQPADKTAAAPSGGKEEVDPEKKPSLLPVIATVVVLILILVIVLVVYSSISGL